MIVWRLAPGRAAAGEDVEDDVGGTDAVRERLGAGGLDGGEAVVASTAARMVTICRSPSSAGPGACLRTLVHGGWQHPVPERRAVT